MGAQFPSPKGAQPPIFCPYLLWPNGCMDHVTWYGARPRPRRLCVRWGPHSALPKRGAEPQPQIFGPCLLQPYGWMDEGGTWHGDRPQPRRLCVRRGPSPLPPKRGRSPPQFSAHFYCGQTAGCIKMPLVIDVGHSPGDFVLDGDPVFPPQQRGGAEPPCQFWPISIVPKRLDASRCHSVWR